MIQETFWDLLRNSAHWEFEIFLMLLFDGVIVGIFYPFVRKHWKHHVDRDQQENIQSLMEIGCSSQVQDWSMIQPGHVRVTPPYEKWPEQNIACGFTKAPSGWICIRKIGHDGSCISMEDLKNP